MTTAHRTGTGGQRRQRPRAKASDGIWRREYGQAVPGLNPTGGPSMIALSRPGWKTTGLCVSATGDAWFSEHGTGKAQRAAQICASCPIRDLCLAAALVFGEEFGIWGGLPPAQRRPFEGRVRAGEPLGMILADALETTTSEVAA
ncbi:MAG: WhiB family transcriptional regulator [Intrasporangium sp.]|uniref:WhiB family transcriptional regulator n=1 Tax=Intrasporangium sp. TaxID=1925024 RepID=UPI0026471086|nr:WhiB family transcriptional regulator [Intrasporangium sp.]MDN5795880.1 WhiB family transcriptional regulator [Intrasporangium sp.]